MNQPSPELFRRARERFEELIEQTAAEREAQLAALAETDPQLAAAVGDLLVADGRADGFLEEPAVPTAVKAWLAANAEEAALGQEIGPYRTVALLGRGGMGEVYLAERADGQFEQRVALKVLRRGMDSDEILRRFLRERQVLARLEHPNIARLLDGGRAPDGRPFIVMERVEGEPITQWCAAHGSAVEERLRLAVTCCEAVELAHRNLIVHRDLKPSNILVSADGQVKLLDFGIAKLLGEDGDETMLTRAGMQVLTPAYAAPEQILGGAVTTATDVYALGVVLYELLTGTLPHDRKATTGVELAAKVSRETVERPSSAARKLAESEADRDDREGRRLSRRLQGDLDTILLKALRRDPARRYPSAAALADDLRRHLDGKPVSARSDSVGYRSVKFAQRHRVGVAAAALVALSLVCSLAAALWQWRRAEAQAERAAGEAERSEHVKAFVISLFREADPLRRAQARELTVSELMEHAVRRLDEELQDEPAVRAQLWDDFALVYGNRGDLDKALLLVRRALALRRQTFGSGPEVADSLNTLSDMLVKIPDYPAAEAAAREALAIQERAFGPDSLQAAEAAERLMIVFHHVGRYEEALALVRKVLAAKLRDLGPNDPSTALQTMNLGSFLVQTGRLREGETTLRDAVARLEAAHGPGHTKVGFALQNLAETLERQGRAGEAVPLLERATTILDEQLGSGHSMAVGAREQLAHARAAAQPRR
jgi:serine/threonine protein kinase